MKKKKSLTCYIRQDKPLVIQSGMRSPSGHALDGRFQSQERALLDRRGDLGAHAVVDHALVHDDRPSRLSDALEHGLSIPGVDRPQVDELDAGPSQVLLGCRDGRGAQVERLAVGDDGQISAGLDHLGFAEREGVVFVRDVLDGGTVQDFGLHEDDRVVAFQDGGQEEALGLGWRAWHDHAEPGDVREESFWGLRVVSDKN